MNNFVAVRCLLVCTFCLQILGCSSSAIIPDELAIVPIVKPSIEVRYVDLLFPRSRHDMNSMQLALVNKKARAANIERTLLKRHVPYQWVCVEADGQPQFLLLAGPFKSLQQLHQQRLKLSLLLNLDAKTSMPALAYFSTDQSIGNAVAANQAENSVDIEGRIPKALP